MENNMEQPPNFESDPDTEPEKEPQEQPITTEHLISEKGQINSARILELEDLFRKADKKIYLDYRGLEEDEQIEAIVEATAEADEKFRIATNVLLNTLDVTNDPGSTGIVFYNLKRLLRVASGNPSNYYSLYQVYDRIIQNYPKIENCLEHRTDPLESLVLIFETGNDEQKINVKNFLISQMPVMESYLIKCANMSFHHPDDVSAVFASLLENGEQVRGDIENIIQNLLFDPEKSKVGTQVLDHLYNSKNNTFIIDDMIEKIVFTTLCHYNIDETIAQKWTKEWSKFRVRQILSEQEKTVQTRGLFVSTNLESVIKLETKKPGLPKFLFEKYGISNFGRYPIEMLIEQVENMDNMEKPYGVMLYPDDDYNGAFHSQMTMFDDFRYRLKRTDYLIRIYECGSKKDVAKALIDLDSTYGGSHKISFAIIGGHGTKDSISFGDDLPKRNILRSNDLHRSRVQKTGDFFESDATIILVSCSTGQNEGIGQILSEKFGMKVIAPTVPTNVNRIYPKISNGKIDFDTSYSKEGSGAVYVSKKASITDVKK